MGGQRTGRDHDRRRRPAGDRRRRARALRRPRPPRRCPRPGPTSRESARNRFVGLVTRVLRDTVMAQVEMQCGPYRVVSLMSREAADELGLEPGVTAVASVKSTNVVVEVTEVSCRDEPSEGEAVACSAWGSSSAWWRPSRLLGRRLQFQLEGQSTRRRPAQRVGVGRRRRARSRAASPCTPRRR